MLRVTLSLCLGRAAAERALDAPGPAGTWEEPECLERKGESQRFAFCGRGGLEFSLDVPGKRFVGVAAVAAGPSSFSAS